MTPNEWAAIGVAVVTLITSFALLMRYMVKSIMRELLPNHGKSLRDQVSRIETRLDDLILHLIDKKELS